MLVTLKVDALEIFVVYCNIASYYLSLIFFEYGKII